jgi:Zn-dependent protease with chaperone function
MSASADYFDGKTSRRHPVVVELDAGMLRVAGEGFALSLRADVLRARPRVAGTPLRVELPDGGLLVGDALEAFTDEVPAFRRGRTDLLEAHPGVAMLAIVLFAAFTWFAYRAAIPWTAELMARRFPVEVERTLGETVMTTLDRHLFKASQLEPARQAALTTRFEAMRAQAAVPHAVLVFRRGDTFGANAFALPGGTVVMTDELAERLTEDQVMAVLAHEVGHVEGRHSLRALFQNSAVAVGATALFGDAGAVTLLAGTLPMLLVQSDYSRVHEAEADAFALGLLRRAGLSPALLGDALESISRPQGHDDDDGGEDRWESGPLRYLSTHPVTDDRIRAAREAAVETR